jgi:hypothetical protein
MVLRNHLNLLICLHSKECKCTPNSWSASTCTPTSFGVRIPALHTLSLEYTKNNRSAWMGHSICGWSVPSHTPKKMECMAVHSKFHQFFGVHYSVHQNIWSRLWCTPIFCGVNHSLLQLVGPSRRGAGGGAKMRDAAGGLGSVRTRGPPTPGQPEPQLTSSTNSTRSSLAPTD